MLVVLLVACFASAPPDHPNPPPNWPVDNGPRIAHPAPASDVPQPSDARPSGDTDTDAKHDGTEPVAKERKTP